MDRIEKIAYLHLRHRGFTDIVYEPDGNVSPDFAVNARLAVEVRLLNENEPNSPKPKGLDSTEIPFLKALDALLASFGAPVQSSWWVRVSYRRPLPVLKKLKPRLRSFLSAVVKDQPARRSFTDESRFQLEVFPRQVPASASFCRIITRDDDSGGMLIELLERNLRLCIADKSAKSASMRPRYSEWWLVLIDNIAFGVSEFDRPAFRESVKMSHDWDKVVLVSPHDPTNFLEL